MGGLAVEVHAAGRHLVVEVKGIENAKPEMTMRRSCRRLFGLIGVALVTPVFVSACDREDHDVRVSTKGRDRSNATFVARDTTRRLGPGDVQIVNTDSTLQIGLYGDSIVTGFGSKAIEKIKSSTDTADVGSGLGASIEKFVKSTVADALNHEITYAVADVQDVRYENGKLEFYWKDGSRMKLFENTSHNRTPMSETFQPDDARRFVAAFKARKAARG